MSWWSRHLQRRAKKKLKRLPVFERGPALFRLRYPDVPVGVGTYGVPVVHDWGEGASLSIGAYCSIADRVDIFLGGHHRTDWATTFPFPALIPEASHIAGYNGTHGDVVIGSDVWLCSGCTILSGVTIGHGAVVAAEAVVSRDVEPYAVVAGNPARPVRWRFNEEVREALLASEWWTWPVDEVRSISPLLCSQDLTPFLDYARQRAAARR